LTEQFTLSKRAYDALLQAAQVSKELEAERGKLSPQTDEKSQALNRQLEELAGRRGQFGGGGGGRAPMAGTPTISRVTTALEALVVALQDADLPPTSQQQIAVNAQLKELDQLMERWRKLKASF
jgi:hypothetical protein